MPAPVHAMTHEGLREPSCPRTGSYHHHTMSKEQNPAYPTADGIRQDTAAGLQGRGFPFGTAGPKPKPRGHASKKDASLVGLGRLERPTSRLSGVRSNQLSYRPESHPFDRRCEAATRDGRKLAHPPGGRSHASGGDHGCAKGRADGGGPLCSRRCVNIAAWAAPRAEARSTGPKGAP